MSKEAKRTGVASYEPRWVEVWTRGPVEPVRLNFPTHASAVAQRHALYRLRDAMRMERHPMSGEADKCKISGPFAMEDNPGKDKKKGHYIVVQSRETIEGLRALEEAGFHARPAPSLDD